MIEKSKYIGCFLGLAMGDAYGAVYEGGILEKFVWSLIGKTKGKLRYTDDTQMSIDLAKSFLENKEINQDKLAMSFANSYRWSRGYGVGAAWLLKNIKKGGNWNELNVAKYKDGSFGNGAAMRAPILALCYSDDIKVLIKNVKKASEITHANILAIEGAMLIAISTYGALKNWDNEMILKELLIYSTLDDYKKKINLCIKYINETNGVNNKIIKENLGNGIAAINSTITAIYFALKHRNDSHNIMFKEIFSLSGDTDTIGAMAGGIWGAFNGAEKLDNKKANRIEDYKEIKELAGKLWEYNKEKSLHY